MNNPSLRKLKILFVTTRLPSHLTTGDRLRTYQLMKGLSNRGHHIDLLGFENPYISNITTDIYDISNLVHQIPYPDIEFQNQSSWKKIQDLVIGHFNHFPRRVWQFHSTEMLTSFKEILSNNYYDIIHFSQIGVAELLDQKYIPCSTAIVFDLIDAVSLSVKRSLKYQFDITWPFRFIEYRQLLRFEQCITKKVDLSLVVSTKDLEFLCTEPNSNIKVIPIGINIPIKVLNREKNIDLLFVGNMTTQANQDAVQWFIAKVWPFIQSKRPETNLYIVGRDPRMAIQRLASDQIIVTGSVKDIHPYLSRAKIFVAPIRIGAGQKTKILEAFSYRLSVIATTTANEGIDAQDGESIILRDNPYNMALEIIHLLNDAQKRCQIGENSFHFIKKHFSTEHITDLIENYYYSVIKN